MDQVEPVPTGAAADDPAWDHLLPVPQQQEWVILTISEELGF